MTKGKKPVRGGPEAKRLLEAEGGGLRVNAMFHSARAKAIVRESVPVERGRLLKSLALQTQALASRMNAVGGVSDFRLVMEEELHVRSPLDRCRVYDGALDFGERYPAMFQTVGTA